ncbi:MBL fold metallo-hydrolase [soil metagenome]
MHLTCIGTGTAAPEPERVCSGHLLECQGIRLLLDCGGGVVHNMARFAVPWADLTHLAITHFHNDHIGDVPLLFFAWKHGVRPARNRPLTLIGPKGTKRLIERMAKAFGAHLSDPGFDVDLREIEPDEEIHIGDDVRFRAAKTPHTDESLAYRVEAASRSFCYTGDTGPSREVAIFAQSADLLLTECSLPDADALPTHLTPSSVAAMSRAALPRRLLLTHIYPQLDRARLPELVRLGGWPARVEIAEDGGRYEV